MALDYFKYNQKDDFYIKLIRNNAHRYPTGMTGYEQFYTDIQAFWREMYNPIPPKSYYGYYYGSDGDKQFIPIDQYNQTITELFVCEDYRKLSAQDVDVDRNKVMALRIYNGEYELHKLIDTIPVNCVFDEKGKQTQEPKYYITDNNEMGYQ
jgi:hypothetical protein